MRMFYKKLLWSGFAVLALSGAGSTWAADSSLVYASRPADILEIAKGFGRAALEKDSTGDPKVTGRINGTKYMILFYECENNKNCKALQFVAGWKTKKSLSVVNQFNAKKRFGRVYLDSDGEVMVEFDVELAHGVTQGNLEEVFRDWSQTLKVVERDLLDED
ncbi:hypothetical protein AGMMS49960_16700 [Betaproteobacteria bacterium]|nr:hypothetical protein AGMMS49543_03440 [Betaproteobacteria bacterium]GHU03043.1 hypothetical protein AGMMS49960_16700 [Betaproteobacteria bacterium]GHU24951.1 hypothetical protein AGMMS50243_28640 [Betaproteobacteria bacterium]